MYYKTHLSKSRQSESMRKMFRETVLHTNDFILPYFVIDGENQKKPIPSLDGVYQLSIDVLLKDIQENIAFGLNAILLFGVPPKKDTEATYAYRDDGIVQIAVSTIKRQYPSLIVITDCCLCTYVCNGNCFFSAPNGDVDIQKTLDTLSQIAVSQSRSGADIIAPSAMMDGMVYAIRQGLIQNHFQKKVIMSYAVKYASSLYAPFRNATAITKAVSTRKSHQMDISNVNEAVLETLKDIDEGADMIIVKPSMWYLDIIYQLKMRILEPVVAYHVSGEYAMLKFLSKNGMNEKDVVMESMVSLKRAKADKIITYYTPQILQWLKDDV